MFDNKNLTPEEKQAKLDNTCNNVIMIGSAALVVTCATYMGIHCIKALAGTENVNTNQAFRADAGVLI